MILSNATLWHEYLRKARQDKHKWKVCHLAEMVANHIEVKVLDMELPFNDAVQPAITEQNNKIGLMPGAIKDSLNLLEKVWEWADQLHAWREIYEVPDPPPPPPLPDIMDDPFSGKPLHESDIEYLGNGEWAFICAKGIQVKVPAPNKRAAIAKFNVRPEDA